MPENMEWMMARHSLKPKGEGEENQPSEEYEGVSNKGVELARERAGEILKYLETTPPGTVLFLAGTSEMVRTDSTMKAFADELKDRGTQKGVLVLTEDDIKDPKAGYTEIVDGVVARLQENPEGRAVVEFPLHLKEMGFARWAGEYPGGLSEFSSKIIEASGGNEKLAMEEWFRNQGRMGDLEGPNPTEVAKDQLRAMERLHEFAEKQMPMRNVVVGGVGHSWNLDAVAVYLANDGREADFEGYQKAGGSQIKETEIIRLEKGEEEGEMEFVYGDRFKKPVTLEEKMADHAEG